MAVQSPFRTAAAPSGLGERVASDQPVSISITPLPELKPSVSAEIGFTQDTNAQSQPQPPGSSLKADSRPRPLLHGGGQGDPTAEPVERSSSCGPSCALVTAVLLVLCGSAILVFGLLSAVGDLNLPKGALEKVCRQGVEGAVECAAVVVTDIGVTARDVSVAINSCIRDIKHESFECSCPSAEHTACDCNGTTYGLVHTWWKWGSVFLGVTGCLCSWMLAFWAFMARKTERGCCSVTGYSQCAGVLWLFFIIIGAVFVSAALAVKLKFQGNEVAIWIDGCEEKLGGDQLSCANKRACKMIRDFVDKIFVLGLGMGVPFFSAGCSMFVACYASSCCLAGFRATVANQLRNKDDVQLNIASENSEYTEGRLTSMLDQQAQLHRAVAEKSSRQSPSQGLEVTSFLGTREKVDFPTIIPYETFNTATGFVAGGSIGRGTLGINSSGIVGRTGSFSDLLQAQIDRLTLEVQSMEELDSDYPKAY